MAKKKKKEDRSKWKTTENSRSHIITLRVPKPILAYLRLIGRRQKLGYQKVLKGFVVQGLSRYQKILNLKRARKALKLAGFLLPQYPEQQVQTLAGALLDALKLAEEGLWESPDVEEKRAKIAALKQLAETALIIP